MRQYRFWSEKKTSTNSLLFAYVARAVAQTLSRQISMPRRALWIKPTPEPPSLEPHQKAGEVIAHTGLAFAQVMAGEYTEGIASAHEALAVAEKSGDTKRRHATLLMVSNACVCLWLGSAHESLPYWAAATEGAKALGGRLLLGEWFAAVEAESLIDAVDPATGLRRAQEALDLSQNAESMIGEALAERAIGRALAAGKEGPQEALLHLTRSVEICDEIGARFELARSLLALGAVHLAWENRTEAATILTKARAMLQECQLDQEESIAQDLLAKLRLP